MHTFNPHVSSLQTASQKGMSPEISAHRNGDWKKPFSKPSLSWRAWSNYTARIAIRPQCAYQTRDLAECAFRPEAEGHKHFINLA